MEAVDELWGKSSRIYLKQLQSLLFGEEGSAIM